MPPLSHLIRAYLRASTDKQDADRARQYLIDFAAQHDCRIAGFYPENETGITLKRPELFRLLADSQAGDVLLLEKVDRLSRLTEADWKKLRHIIDLKGLKIVAVDLPTSYQFMAAVDTESFNGRMLAAVNNMMLDMLAAIARKDYEDRVRVTRSGIDKALAHDQQVANGEILGEKKYKGRALNHDLHVRVRTCLAAGMTVRRAAQVAGCAKSTVQRVKATLNATKP